MATVRRRDLKPSKPLAPSATRWAEVPKELKEKLLKEAKRNQRRAGNA
jgi:hypothetical protein